MNAISIKNVNKSYKDLVALKGISFDVEEGDFFGFLLPNEVISTVSS